MVREMLHSFAHFLMAIISGLIYFGIWKIADVTHDLSAIRQNVME